LDWDRIKAEAKKNNGYAKNYKVPNFGVDKDIIDSQNNLKATEKKLGKKFTLNSEYENFLQEE
jgi:hypothetical protein